MAQLIVALIIISSYSFDCSTYTYENGVVVISVDAIPSDWLVHPLHTKLVGNGYVVIPKSWDDGSFIILREGWSGTPIVRIHSRCSFGDIFGSTLCDCEQQLHKACRSFRFSQSGSLLFYLEQEGRGAGLSAKSSAHRAFLEEQIDTFSFYRRKFGSPDLRDYQHVAKVLKEMGLKKIRLLTNNPDKLSNIIRAGIEVKQVPHNTAPHANSMQYLTAKLSEGHSLSL